MMSEAEDLAIKELELAKKGKSDICKYEVIDCEMMCWTKARLTIGKCDRSCDVVESCKDRVFVFVLICYFVEILAYEEMLKNYKDKKKGE